MQYNTIVSDIIHSLTIWGLQSYISELPLIVFFFFFSENVHTPFHRRLFCLRFPSRECFAIELAYISLWKLTSLGFQVWVPFKLHLFSKFGVVNQVGRPFVLFEQKNPKRLLLGEKSIG